jgi:hypothetical protein
MSGVAAAAAIAALLRVWIAIWRWCRDGLLRLNVARPGGHGGRFQPPEAVAAPAGITVAAQAACRPRAASAKTEAFAHGARPLPRRGRDAAEAGRDRSSSPRFPGRACRRSTQPIPSTCPRGPRRDPARRHRAPRQPRPPAHRDAACGERGRRDRRSPPRAGARRRRDPRRSRDRRSPSPNSDEAREHQAHRLLNVGILALSADP